MLLDTLARQLGIHMDKLQFSAAVGRGRLCEKRVLLAKPMTFMNNSGESVGKLARYYKVQHLLSAYMWSSVGVFRQLLILDITT